MQSADVQATFCATLVDEWARAGIAHAVVSPGSRSTPMLLALAAEARISVHVVLDERSAGHVALGLGMSTGRPALVLTTSGTAAAELHPAVVEADAAGVCLVVLTADRPTELHGVGSPQTIDQHGLYGSAVRWFAEPGVADLASADRWRSLGARAVAASLNGPGGPGPVHLNLAFREPLVGAAQTLPPGRNGGAEWHRVQGERQGVPAEVVEMVVAAEHGLVIAGADSGDPRAVLGLSAALGWPLLADPSSGCRLPSPLTVAAADGLLRCQSVASWKPQVVLRLGRPAASKVLSGWLSALGPGSEMVLVDPHGRWSDPEVASGLVLRTDPSRLCRTISARVSSDIGSGLRRRSTKDWATRWSLAEEAAQSAITEQLALETEITEPGLARALAAELEAGTTLVVSSSMPVRDLEWFAAPRRDLRVLANRGANGIDGVLSTAVGVALGGHQTVCLLGDLAFCYDAGAMLHAAKRAISLRVVVVDNQGGGIFSFLPQAELDRDLFESSWAVPHGIELAGLAEAYGIPTRRAHSVDQAVEAVAGRGGEAGVEVVIVPSDRQTNVEVHRRLNEAIQAAVSQLTSGGDRRP